MSQAQVVEAGTVVIMHYTLKDPAGVVLDSSSGREPLAYLHGAKNIVPGLERQLAGKRAGDTVSAVVPPEEGYGERQGPPQAIERSAFPEGVELAAGMQVVAHGRDGQSFPLWIVEVADEQIVVDPNHPLAGVTLHFDVEITDVREASEGEKAHGHPHGPGGHDE